MKKGSKAFSWMVTLSLLFFAVKISIAQNSRKPLKIKDVGDISGFATISAFSQLNNSEFGDFTNFKTYFTLSIKNKLSIGKITLVSTLFDETELVMPFDSITYATQDLLTVKHNLIVPFNKDYFSVAIFRYSRTQLLNKYSQDYDSNLNAVRSLESSYLSPGFVTFGASVSMQYDKEGSNVQIIIAGGRRTKVLNQAIYQQYGRSKIAGVEKGQKKTLAYGIGCSNNTIMTRIWKKVFFENSCDAFVPYQRVTSLDAYTFDINTAFHFNLTKHIRISYRNKIFMDQQVQEKPLVSNSLTIGWYADKHF